MNLLFEPTKKYKLTFLRNGQELFFTGQKICIVKDLIAFTDKYGQRMVFALEMLKQAEEVKP